MLSREVSESIDMVCIPRLKYVGLGDTLGEWLLLQLRQPMTDPQKKVVGKIIREYTPKVEIDITGEPVWKDSLDAYLVPTEALHFPLGVFPSEVFRKVDHATA